MSNKNKLLTALTLVSLLQAPAVKAYDINHLPPLPQEWGIRQKVHVQFIDFNDTDKAELIRYFKSLIEPMNLDIELVFDDNLQRTDGAREGIKIMNTVGTTTTCFKTSTSWGYTNDLSEAVRVKTIRIDTTCYGGQRTGTKTIEGVEYPEDIYWHNVITHELLHGLDLEHLPYIKPMPATLMWSSTELEKRLIFTFNDQWNLKRIHNRDSLTRYKRINFKRADLGKTCYLIKESNPDKSVSFPVDNLSIPLPYLKSFDKYKVVVK